MWLRVWHGLQALLFLGPIATGLNMHYAGSEYLATTGETFFAPYREMITGDRAPRDSRAREGGDLS